MPNTVFPQRAVSGVSGNGVTRSISLPGAKIASKSKDFGSTPTIVSGLVVGGQGAPDDARVPREAALPERMAEEGDARGVETAFLRGEIPPERQRDAEQIEKVVGHADAAQAFRIARPVSVWRRPKSKNAK
jgi:hypothetical protein